jgi:hypothetical protein
MGLRRCRRAHRRAFYVVRGLGRSQRRGYSKNQAEGYSKNPLYFGPMAFPVTPPLKEARGALGKLLVSEIVRRGYRSVSAAAAAAGISAYVLFNWIRADRRPRPAIFWRTLDRLGIPRVPFHRYVPPPKPACVYCDKPPADSSWQVLRRRGRQREPFAHARCRRNAHEGHRKVPCIECGHTLLLQPCRVRALKWKKERDGVLYRRCGTCSSRLHANPRRLLRGIIKKRDPQLAELVELDGKEALKQPEVRAQIRAHLRAITPRGWNRASARPNLSVRKVVEARLHPRFALCSVCGLLLYGASRERPRSCFHRQCWALFVKSRGYSYWRLNGTASDVASFPWPDAKRGRGRPKDAAPRLLTRYRLLTPIRG